MRASRSGSPPPRSESPVPRLSKRINCAHSESAASSQPRVAEAVDRVVVHEADGLHERVAHRRPDEPETALLQILRERMRELRLRRQLGKRAPAADDRLSVDEAPEICVEAAAVCLDLEYP